MATRSIIGIQNENKTITYIYCHNDGNISGVGKILFDNYSDENKIKDLMKLGDLSSLGTEPISNPHSWEKPSSEDILDHYAQWFAETHPENMCNTYASRGENCPATTVKDLDKFLAAKSKTWAEYAYLFRDGEWFVFNGMDEHKLADLLY